MKERIAMRFGFGVVPACLTTLAIAVSAGSLGGCTPAEFGSIDIEKSKAIAAEKGIGPGVTATPSKKGKKQDPPTALVAPTAPPPR